MKQILDYSQEPETVFTPLSRKRYREFYEIEMNDFSDDLNFYLTSLERGMEVLDVGCGSGRLSRALAAHGMRVVGIDNSIEMLTGASSMKGSNIKYVCMDMLDMALDKRFDAAFIAYNTLNLLKDVANVRQTLTGCRHHLKENGLLLLQIFIPRKKTMADQGARTFQFQIFKSPKGGKIIKETLKSFTGEYRLILEERYRVRPMNTKDDNEDLSHAMHLLALDHTDWIRLVLEAGFTVTGQYGDFDLSPFSKEKSSMLLIQAKAHLSC